MFKIINIFQKNEENWAIIQKSDVSFRAKEYLVETVEIFHVTGPSVAEYLDIQVNVENNEVKKNANTETD